MSLGQRKSFGKPEDGWAIHLLTRYESSEAGVSAGIDLALALVEEDYGRDLALIVARYMVVFLKRPGGQSQFSIHLVAQMSKRTPIQRAQEYVLQNLSSHLSVEEMAKQACMSTRNFSRLFRHETGMTSADFVETARLDAARCLKIHQCHYNLLLSAVALAPPTGCGEHSCETLKSTL